MSENIYLKYFGWSSFAVETENGKLLFDPIYRPMFGSRFSGLDDYKNTNIICVTHGHYDHCIDVPDILKETKATLLSSKTICDHLNKKHRFEDERLLPIKPFKEISTFGFKITGFPWGHREVSIPKFIKLGLLKAKILSTLYFAWLNSQTPFNAPYFGFYVQCPNNIRIMNYSEGFNDTMNIAEVCELGKKYNTDILLAAMQLDFEDFLAKGASALTPKTVILYHPHKPLFDKFGLKSSSPQIFAEKASRAMPETKVIIAEPGFSIKL